MSIIIDLERPKIQQEIAKAVLVERERCAEIADRCHPPENMNLARTGAWIDAQVKIADLIRKGE